MYDLVIIGGGPAGLTAAIYAIRKRLDVLLVSPDLGGKANAHMDVPGLDTYQVINGAEVVRRFRNEIEYLHFARLLERVTGLEKAGNGFKLATESGRTIEARAVILATGALPVRLDVPGARDYFLKGLSYSTVSYAPLYVDCDVALIGTTPMGLRGAAELGQIARHVYLIAPERGDLDGPLGKRLAAMPAVEVLEGFEPVAVRGDTVARRLVVRGPDGERTLEVAVVFVELGLRPLSELVRGWVECDAQGRVMVNSGAATNVPGLYAAGDVTNVTAEQVLIAIGEGAKAALNAYEYLLNIG